MASMRGEWKACPTRSRVVLWPCARQPAATSRTASRSPEITVASGPLTAAIETRSRTGSSEASTSSSATRSDTIAPPSGSACISRPRAATSAHASGRDQTPATCAAHSSPIEWPSSRSGVTPQCSNSRYSATSTANSAGWVYSVRCTSAASGPSGDANNTSRSGRGRCGSRWAQTASRDAAKTAWRADNSRAMPGYWLPWPVNRKAVRPGCASARTRCGSTPVPRNASSPPRSSARSWASTTARAANAFRVVAAE
ncbi:hypothetical protein EHYA_05615 [Embleya hyalina]|uniref:Uncharacterized protein n=1 Tax=Embleya hyalina TaxID=516124 RepID=A0A401YTN5_9ACTN|nr:hypothetical protein EHYA_05615 [Embleya hyalina]